MTITIEQATQETLKKLDVFSWPIWEKEPSTFPWKYDSLEICYIIEGNARITPINGNPVDIQAGDLVTFPKDLECTWFISKHIKKHYTFK